MTDFVDDNTDLYEDKIATRLVPTGLEEYWWQAVDANLLKEAALSMRTKIQELLAQLTPSTVSVAKATWSGSQNLSTHGTIDWMLYNNIYPPSASTPLRTKGSHDLPAKRLGTHELAHSIDWITDATNSTFADNQQIAGGATLVTSNAGDSVATATGTLTASTAYGFNAGDGVNFGFTLRLNSDPFAERTLKLFLAVNAVTVTITALLADGTVTTDTITVAAATVEAHLATIKWTGGGCVMVSVMVTAQSATGGGIYLYGAALS